MPMATFDWINSYDNQNLQLICERLREELRVTKNKNATLEAQYYALTDESGKIKNEIEIFKRQTSEADNNKTQMFMMEKGKMTKQYADLFDKFNNMAAENDNLCNKFENMRKSLFFDVDTLKAENIKVSNDNNRALERIDTLNNNLNAANMDNDRLNRANADLTQQNVIGENKYAAISLEMNKLQNQHQKLYEDRERVKFENEQLMNKNTGLGKRIEELDCVVNKVSMEKRDLERDFANYRISAEKEMDTIKVKAMKLSEDKMRLHNLLKVSKEENFDLSQKLDALRQRYDLVFNKNSKLETAHCQLYEKYVTVTTGLKADINDFKNQEIECVNEYKRINTELLREVDSLKIRNAELTEENMVVNNERIKITKAHDNLKIIHMDLDKKYENLANNHNALIVDRNDLEMSFNKLTDKCNVITIDNRKLADKVNSLEFLADDLKKQVFVLTNDNEDLNKKYNCILNDKQILDSNFETLRNQCADISDKFNACNRKCEMLERNVIELQEINMSIKRDNKILNSQKMEVENNYELLNQQNGITCNKLAACETALAELDDKHKKLSCAYKDLNATKAAIEREFEILKQQHIYVCDQYDIEKQKHATCRQDKDILEANYLELREKYTKETIYMENRYAGLHSQHCNLTNRFDSLCRDKEVLDAKHCDLYNKFTELGKRFDILNNDNCDLQKRHTILSQNYNETCANLEDATKANCILESKFNELRENYMKQKIDFDNQYEILKNQFCDVANKCEILQNKHEQLSADMFMAEKNNAELQNQYMKERRDHEEAYTALKANHLDVCNKLQITRDQNSSLTDDKNALEVNTLELYEKYMMEKRDLEGTLEMLDSEVYKTRKELTNRTNAWEVDCSKMENQIMNLSSNNRNLDDRNEELERNLINTSNEKSELIEKLNYLENQHLMLKEQFEYLNNEKEQLKNDKCNLEKINFNLEDERVRRNIINVELKIERDMLKEKCNDVATKNVQIRQQRNMADVAINNDMNFPGMMSSSIINDEPLIMANQSAAYRFQKLNEDYMNLENRFSNLGADFFQNPSTAAATASSTVPDPATL